MTTTASPQRAALSEIPTPTSWIVATGSPTKGAPAGATSPKTAAQLRLESYVASPKVAKTRSDIENRLSEAENRREMETEQKQFKGASLSARKLEQVRAQNEASAEALKVALFQKMAAAEQRAAAAKHGKAPKAAAASRPAADVAGRSWHFKAWAPRGRASPPPQVSEQSPSLTHCVIWQSTGHGVISHSCSSW